MLLSSANLFLNFFSLLFADVIVVPYLNKNLGGSTDLAHKKRHESADLHAPIHSPATTLDQVYVGEDNIYLLV